MKVVGVIPARIGSTRFPRKPLYPILGKPLIQWVYEGAQKYPHFSDLLVATDSLEITSTVEGFGGRAILTSPDHASGTLRVYEVAKNLNADVIVNIQGDEPLIDDKVLSRLISPFEKDFKVAVTTLKRKFDTTEELFSPHQVKVVVNKREEALFFSRSIPTLSCSSSFCSDKIIGNFENYISVFHHVGLYAFRYQALQDYVAMKKTFLEEEEKLEQLRICDGTFRILVPTIRKKMIGVDTKEDVTKVENILGKSDKW